MQIRFVEGQGKQAFIDGAYAGKYSRNADGSYDVWPANPEEDTGHYPGVYNRHFSTYEALRTRHEKDARRILEHVGNLNAIPGHNQDAPSGGYAPIEAVGRIAEQVNSRSEIEELVARSDRRAELFGELAQRNSDPQQRIWRHLQLRELAMAQSIDAVRLEELYQQGHTGLDPQEEATVAEGLDSYREALDAAMSPEEPAPYYQAITDGLAETLPAEEAEAVLKDERLVLAEEASVEEAMRLWSEARFGNEQDEVGFGAELHTNSEAYREAHEEYSKACASEERAHDLGKPVRDAVDEHHTAGQEGSLDEIAQQRREAGAELTDLPNVDHHSAQIRGLYIANQLNADYGTPNTHLSLSDLAQGDSEFSELQQRYPGHPTFAEPDGLIAAQYNESQQLLDLAEYQGRTSNATTEAKAYMQYHTQQQAGAEIHPRAVDDVDVS